MEAIIKCAGCIKHQWKEIPPLEIVWTDPTDEKGYCLFHAPKDEKWVGKRRILAPEFNMLFREKAKSIYTARGKTSLPMHGVVFPGDINLTEFFVNSYIDSIVLNGSTFCGNVLLQDCVVGQVDMAEAEFRGEVYFSRTVFQKNPSFVRARFCKGVDFSEAEFREGACFTGANFEAPVWFSKSIFGGEMSFYATRSADNVLRMQRLNQNSLSHIHYSSLEVRNFSFCECEPWPDCFGQKQCEKISYLQLEELYRAMKQRALEQHDQPQASHWHFREKLMFKKQSWCRRWLPITLTWWYWATSGFGERAVRAGVWLAALLVLPFLANSPIGAWFSFLFSSLWSAIPGTAHVDAFAAAIRDSIDATTAVGFIPFMKEANGANGWAKVGQALWQALIALQFTLFALAVRNRFRR